MRPYESLMKSGESLNQREELTEEEDQKSFMMIGGIHVFLLGSQVKASAHDESSTEEEGQPTVTIKEKEEMEQTSKYAPTEEDHANKILTPWELELEMLEGWLEI
jgi:hypothetical protein